MIVSSAMQAAGIALRRLREDAHASATRLGIRRTRGLMSHVDADLVL
jgi:hypothetical protein